MFYNNIGGDMMCNHENLLKTKLVEYCKTKDESLFDEEVLDEVINYIVFSCKGWFKYECYTKEDIIEICLCHIGLYINDYDPDKSDITTFLYLLCNHAMQKAFRYKNEKFNIIILYIKKKKLIHIIDLIMIKIKLITTT